MELQLMIGLFRTLSAAAVLSVLLAVGASAQFSSQQTWQATTTGSANAITIPIPNIAGLPDLIGVPVRFIPSVTNTSAATAAVGGTAATSILKATPIGLVPLVGQELIAGQMTVISYDGVEYVLNSIIAPQPTLAANTSFYVSTSGNDANTGQTSGAAWATLQHAATFISKYNANGFTITVNVANGTYAPFTMLPVGGNGTVNYVGNTATPTNVVISANNISAVTAFGVLGQSLNGFELIATGAAPTDSLGACLYEAAQSSLTISNMVFGTCYGDGAFVQQSNLNVGSGTFAVSGGSTGEGTPGCNPGCGAVFDSNYGGFISGSNSSMTITSAVSVVYFLSARSGGYTSLWFTSITNYGNVTGTRVNCVLNAVIETITRGLSYYPGTIAGSCSSGGQSH
jgi:hypothetical protein